MNLSVKRDNLKILKLSLLPLVLIIFYSVQFSSNNHLDKPLLGINRLYFILPGCILFTCFIILNVSLYFIKNYGLKIDNNGIKFKTSFISEERITWNSIEKIESFKRNQIAIFVTNPDAFIKSSNSKFKTWLYKRNAKVIGTPIVITTSMLKTSNKLLLTQLNDLLLEYKN